MGDVVEKDDVGDCDQGVEGEAVEANQRDVAAEASEDPRAEPGEEVGNDEDYDEKYDGFEFGQ